MSKAQIQDWLNDAAEAIAIGREIGEKTLVISTSTGGTLLAALAVSKRYFSDRDKLVLISPNFGLNKRMARILTWPFSQIWMPLIFGSERTFKSRGDLHSYFWTTRYSTQSVIKMAKMTNAIAKLDFSKAKWSVLFMYSKRDKVVKPWLVERVFNAWGGRKSKLIVEVGEHDDPNSHVICGDVMSPSMNDYFVDKIVDWALDKNQET
jgi:alpha-beta hydrolase superfamily lysophospholipase